MFYLFFLLIVLFLLYIQSRKRQYSTVAGICVPIIIIFVVICRYRVGKLPKNTKPTENWLL